MGVKQEKAGRRPSELGPSHFSQEKSLGKVLEDREIVPCSLEILGGSERRELDTREERLLSASVEHKVIAHVRQ
jgi:hypothetical protein